MNIQIDTTQKVIRIAESVGLQELTDSLEALLPNGKWKEFKLETNTQLVWSNPIIIKEWVYPPYNPYPTIISPMYELPFITYDNNITDKNNCAFTLNDGVFNVQLGTATPANN